MPLESLWGGTALPQLLLPTRLLLGYTLLLLYGITFAYALYRQRADYAAQTQHQWAVTALLIVSALLLGQLLPLQLLPGRATPNDLTPISQSYLGLFSLVALLLAGGSLSPGAALIVGFFTGLGQALWQSHQIFDPFYYALVGLLAAYSLNPATPWNRFRWVRYPVVAGPLSPLLLVWLVALGAYCYTPPTLSSSEALAWTLAHTGRTALALAAAGLASGLAVTILYWAIPAWHSRPGTTTTNPQAQSLRTRLMLNFGLFAGTVGLFLLLLILTLSVSLSRQLLTNQMAVTAQTVSQRIPQFRAGLQTFLQQANSLAQPPDSTPQATTEMLRQIYSQGGQFQQLIAVTAAGQVLATYPAGSLPTLTREEQSASRDALAAQAAMITSGQAGSEYLVSVIVPMFNSAGQPIGTLIGRIPSLVVADLVDGVNGIPNPGQVMVLDERSQVIAGSDQASRLASWTPPTTPVKTYPGRADVGGTVYEGIATGQGREIAYALAGGQSHPWTTVVTMPYAALITQALQISIPWLGIFLLLMVAFGANLWVIGQSITRPLNELVTASQHVAQGGLNTPIQIESHDEIGQLGQAFESMRFSIKSQLDEVSLLLTASQAVSASINIQEGMPTVLQSALKGTGAAGVRAVVVNPSGRYPLTFGEGELAASMERLDRQVASLVRSQGELLLHTPGQIRREFDIPAGVDSPVRALTAIPLYSQKRFQGVLWLGHNKAHQFTSKELDLLRTLAGQASVLVENARLFATAEGGRRRLAAVLASTADAVIVTDQTERILLINPAMEQAFQLEASKVMGRPVTAVIQSTQLLETLLNEAKRPRNMEITAADGRTLFTSAATIYSNDGQVLGRVAVLHDISYLKELDEMKSEFVATVSHDLRGPLTYMRGYMTMLPMVGEINIQQQEYIDKIMAGIQQMSTLIEDLLDLGRLEAGVELMRDEIVPGILLRRVAREQAEPAGAQGIELKVYAMPDVPVVVGDEALVQRAMVNLVSNAIKYAPQSGTVTLMVEREKNEVIFSVQDHGPGIAKADQVRLFEKFYQVKQRSSARVKGSGLGLSIVKSVAERHGGRAWCESQVGMGSTFYFSLPVS